MSSGVRLGSPSAWLHAGLRRPHPEPRARRLCEALSPSPPRLCSFTTSPCTWSGLPWASSPAQPRPRRRKSPSVHLWNQRRRRSQKPVRAATGIGVSWAAAREGGGATALNVCRACGLKSFLRPGDQRVSYPCISWAREMSFKKWNAESVDAA